MGKAEGQKELWHGHVTAVTVAPDYRRIGAAKQLMDSLEAVSEQAPDAHGIRDWAAPSTQGLGVGSRPAIMFMIVLTVLS